MPLFLVKVISHVVINETDLLAAKRAFKKHVEDKNISGAPISIHNESTDTTYDVVGVCEVSGIPITEGDSYHTDSEGVMWLKEFGE